MSIFNLENPMDQDLKKKYELELSIFESIFQSAMEAIMVTDINNQIMWVNQAFESLYLYSFDEVVGETPQILQSDYHEQDYHFHIWDTLEQSGQWQGEVWNRRKDGSIIPVHQSIVRLFSEEQNTEYIVSTSFDISEKKDTELKMFQLAYLDSVTGLKNKYFIQDQLEDQMCNGLLIIKCKNLRQIEMQHGEQVANLLFKNIVNQIRRAHFHQEIYHYSGNRMLMVFHENHLHETIHSYIQTLENVLSTIFTVKNHVLKLDYAIGFVLQDPQEQWTLPQMIRKAQISIAYGEKQNHQTVTHFHSDIENAMLNEEQLLHDLSIALKEDQIHVHFQPFVDISNGELYGAEALARWTHPVNGPISPVDFIDIAEKHHLINDLGEIVLLKACRHFKPWLERDPKLILNINVSVLQLSHVHFIDIVKTALEETAFPPDRLVFEVTESIAIDNLETVLSAMNTLHNLGIQFALDDFGMGFSSLSKLKNIPVSTVKVDRSFVVDIHSDVQDALLVSAIIALAQHLGLTVIVEGIEEASQIRFLKNNACQIIQGFYFSKPVPPEIFETFIGNIFTQYDPSLWTLSMGDYKPYDANKGIHQVLSALYRPPFIQAQIKTCLDSDLPKIEANEKEINQVLKHLITNAREAIDGAYDIQQGKIIVETSFSDSSIIIAVSDNGPGIPQEMINRVFDPFFTTKPRGIGTGLGLSTSKDIIANKHYGDLFVRSNYGNGATFIIELPIHQPNTKNDA